LAGSALAANVDGTNGGDQLRGTGSADAIQAKAGNDSVRARAGNDRINAGGGRDRVAGGSGSDRVSGGSGADALAGDAGADVITGGSGSDVLTGGDGNDVIDARDGAVDTVTCGAGEDLAKLDPQDVIADATADNPNGSCETVIRGGSATDPGAGRDCPGHPNSGARGRDPSDDTAEGQS
jgi:Ca2+-binding RTX toxin-like protein